MMISDAHKVFIVEEDINPSSDYFIVPEINHDNELLTRCNWKTLPSIEELDQATVIFVRYIPNTWKRLISKERSRLANVIYFMDDDLWDLNVTSGLPWQYRVKLAMYATYHQKWLKTMGAQIWLSTPWLINKYQNSNPRLVTPKPIFDSSSTFGGQPSNQIRIFYHGSASHRSEIIWLQPIIKEVLKQDDHVTFEIIGDQKVNRLYRILERCTIVNPMKWPSYKAFISQQGRHIGLAPSLPLPFNHARSYTKFFDVTASGAVGIYAKPGPCENIISHGQDGILLNMNPSEWIDAILELAQNQSLRQNIYQTALDKIHALSV